MRETQPQRPEIDNPALSQTQVMQMKAQIASLRSITRNTPVPPPLQMAAAGIAMETYDYAVDSIGNVTIPEDGKFPLDSLGCQFPPQKTHSSIVNSTRKIRDAGREDTRAGREERHCSRSPKSLNAGRQGSTGKAVHCPKVLTLIFAITRNLPPFSDSPPPFSSKNPPPLPTQMLLKVRDDNVQFRIQSRITLLESVPKDSETRASVEIELKALRLLERQKALRAGVTEEMKKVVIQEQRTGQLSAFKKMKGKTADKSEV